jgi:hypothetical protein
VTRALSVNVRSLLYVEVSRVLRSAVSLCTPFAAFIADERENSKFRNAKNVRLAKIHRGIAEVFGEGALNRGNVRKWCRLFEESR